MISANDLWQIEAIVNDKGFSLVQVIVAMGMMSILGLAMMKMNSQQIQNTKTIKVKTEANQFYSEVVSFLSKPEICTSNFKNRSINDEASLEKISYKSGKVKYEKGKLYGQNAFRLHRIYTSDYYSDNGDGIGTIMVNLELEATGNINGNKIQKKAFELNVLTNDHGKITSCSPSAIQTGGGGTVSGKSPAEIKQVITNIVNNPNSAQTNPDAKEIQKVIDSNPTLKALRESAESMKKMNERFEQAQKEAMEAENY